MLWPFRKRAPALRLVIGLNQVDKMIVNGWDDRLNAPTKAAEREIRRRAEDAIDSLADFAEVSSDHLEYYSAARRYRLLPLLGKVISHARAGFKLDQVEPADPFELADPEIRDYVCEEIRARNKKRPGHLNIRERLLEEIQKTLSTTEREGLRSKLKEEMEQPPKVAILGKAGVGKTTTVNALFNTHWKTSPTVVGTHEAQTREFDLQSGGTITMVDLPGYGRSLREDERYERIYRELIPSCDLVLLILQADSRDFSDDQEMIAKLQDWLRLRPASIPEKGDTRHATH